MNSLCKNSICNAKYVAKFVYMCKGCEPMAIISYVEFGEVSQVADKSYILIMLNHKNPV